MTRPPFSIRPIGDAATMTAAREVRRRVFLEEQGVPRDLEFDADDRVALHFVAESEGEVIGTARLLFREDYGKVERMAVLQPWRRAGVGRALLRELLGEIRSRGVERAVLHAQVVAVGFYEKEGFVAVGEQFLQAGIPHRKMEKKVMPE